MGFFKESTVEQRQKRRGLIRAFGYLAALGGVLTFVQIRQARAEVGDKTVELGREMYALANATHHDVNKLSMNGQNLWIGSSTSDDSVRKVLDRYENMCREKRAHSLEEWKTLADKQTKEDAAKETDTVKGAGVVRSGNDNDGAVICFTKTATSKPSLTEAITTFAQTGELGALGAIRYVYVAKGNNGTTVLTAWTDEQLNLKTLFPDDATKDAPGLDFDGIPRPDGSVRILAGRVEDTPFGINIYRGKGEPSAIVAGLDKTLFDQGWIGLDPGLEERHADDPKHPVGRLYEKDGVVLTVAAHLEPDSTITTMGVAGATDGNDTGVNHKKPLFKKSAPLIPGGPKSEP